MRFQYLAVAPVLLLCATVAQQTARRPLTHRDYDGWRSIQGTQLSLDGKFLAYSLFPQEGDGEVVVRNLVTGKERREPAGQRPQAAPPDPGAEPGPETRSSEPRSISMSFTADSRHLVFTTFPAKADTERARKEKKRPEEMPKGGLAIVDLAALDSVAVRIPAVRSFQVSENNGAWLAYLKDPGEPAAGRKAKGKAEQKDQVRSRSRTGTRTAGGTPRAAAALVLRKFAGASERTFASATEYLLTKDGALLVYAVSGKTPENNGVYTVKTGDTAEPAALLKGKGKYLKLTWDANERQLAFISDRDDAAAKQPRAKLYLWDRASGTGTELVSNATPGFHRELVISSNGAVRFSKDGRNLYFGCAPPRSENPPAVTAAEDRPRFDLWHWNDDFIQPMQKARAARERARTYEAVFHLASHKLMQLADTTMPEVLPSDNGRWALGSDDRSYRKLVGYEDRYADTWLIDTATGVRKLLNKKHRGALSWAPTGRYAVLFDGSDWISIAIPSGTRANLTAKLPVKFRNEEDDHPDAAGSYGMAGWIRDGKYVLLYDRFDVWQVAPDGSSARNLTDAEGRSQHVELRYLRLNPDSRDRYINPAEPLLFRATNIDTRESGFWRDRIDSPEKPVRLVMAAKNFGNPVKAKKADVLVLTASTFNEFPDLLVTDSTFKEMRRVSNANPQKEQLLWGTAELIHYKNLDGLPLKGVLYKPENLDPHKEYPMLVFIYERLSQNLHRFVDPRPGTSINISYYVSNGYLVLTPDIAYTVGSPGQSALKCVLPAIQSVVDRGYVNEKAIGIQGHSWGGYQVAYMITQTTRFRAAAAGAPVADMISAYDGIRWGTGIQRQYLYERTQSRIGGTLWQYPTRFIENSPIFMADRVETPLMILHNDGDDAVPWYQGIEYFLALRRLGKEVYLFNYNGEPHGLRKRPNQKDYTVRLQEFFDYYLKGAPKPGWMEKGIPYHGPAGPGRN
jgi:dipeptidyl aminopeptidase/acylaminoacyl peptidase